MIDDIIEMGKKYTMKDMWDMNLIYIKGLTVDDMKAMNPLNSNEMPYDVVFAGRENYFFCDYKDGYYTVRESIPIDMTRNIGKLRRDENEVKLDE